MANAAKRDDGNPGQKISPRMLGQPCDFIRGENLHIFFLHLVSSKPIGRGSFTFGQPSVRFGKVEQSDEKATSIVFGDRADLLFVQILAQVFGRDRADACLKCRFLAVFSGWQGFSDPRNFDVFPCNCTCKASTEF